MANDSWSGQDKAQHFIASAMLSAAGNEYSQHQGMSRDRSAMFGLMFSVSLGYRRCKHRLYRLATDPSLKPHPFSFTVQC